MEMARVALIGAFALLPLVHSFSGNGYVHPSMPNLGPDGLAKLPRCFPSCPPPSQVSPSPEISASLRCSGRASIDAIKPISPPAIQPRALMPMIPPSPQCDMSRMGTARIGYLSGGGSEIDGGTTSNEGSKEDGHNR